MRKKRPAEGLGYKVPTLLHKFV